MNPSETNATWQITHLPAPPARDYHDDPTTDRQLAWLADRMTAVESCLAQGTERMGTMQAELSANTDVTNEVRDILGAAKGFFRFCSAAGVVLKWVGGLAGAAMAIYTGWHMITHGGKPPGQ